MKVIAPIAVCATLALTVSSAAADTVYPQNALRVGIEYPFGDMDGDAALGDVIEYRIPIAVELGAFVGPDWLIGVYGDTGLGKAGSGCKQEALPGSDVDCGFSDLRFALQAQNHGWLDPIWVGLGVGWEWMSTMARFGVTVTDPTSGDDIDAVVTVERTRRGPFVMLSGGVDWVVEGPLRFGPYLSVLWGTYITEGYECEAGCPSGGSVDEPATHGFIGGGLRMSFGPPR